MNLRSRSIELLLAFTTLGLCTSVTLPELASASEDAATPQAANRATEGAMTPLESAVIAEINRMRTNPSAYADWLESMKTYYDDTTLALPDEPRVRTVEGVAAVDDAIAVLNQLDPLPALEFSAGLNHAAHDHVQDLIRIGALTLTGSDGSQPEERVSRYGELSGQATELLNYGNQTAAGLVMQLVISDGNPNRTSRATLLRSDFTVMGAGCDRMSQQMLCVLDYASEYVDNEGSSSENLSAETVEPAETVSSKVDSIDSTTRTEATRSATSTADQVASNRDASNQNTFAANALPDQDSSSPEPDATNNASPDQNLSSPEPAVTELTRSLPPVSPSSLELSAVEQALIDETNLLRANPSAYAEKLERLLPYYSGTQLKLPNQPILATDEGASAVEEAIAVLRTTDSLPLLEPMAGLSLGATDHAVDLSMNNLTGHYGSDRSDPFERISRYGTYHDIAGENISYSPLHTAEWHVIQWLIDDGVSDRSHRETLLKPEYQATGVACEPHAEFGNVCVMTYAGEYTNSEGIETPTEVVQR